MKFAKIVFYTAAAIGALSIGPMYFFEGDYIYKGSLAGLGAWQVAFYIIATDPVRFRPLMIAGMLEKFIWVGTMLLLYALGQIGAFELFTSIPVSLLLGVLFVAAYRRTPTRGASTSL